MPLVAGALTVHLCGILPVSRRYSTTFWWRLRGWVLCLFAVIICWTRLGSCPTMSLQLLTCWTRSTDAGRLSTSRLTTSPPVWSRCFRCPTLSTMDWRVLWRGSISRRIAAAGQAVRFGRPSTWHSSWITLSRWLPTLSDSDTTSMTSQAPDVDCWNLPTRTAVELNSRWAALKTDLQHWVSVCIPVYWFVWRSETHSACNNTAVAEKVPVG